MGNYHYMWMYEVESGVCWVNPDYYTYLPKTKPVLFLSEEEFLIYTERCGIYNFYNGEKSDAGKYGEFIKIAEINDNYYGISYMTVYKILNLYSGKQTQELFELKDYGYYETYGIHIKDNDFFYKDKNNNVFKIDIDQMTQNKIISADQIYQTGKSFLGDENCKGLYVTNDGGFITYDLSDKKIKYISMY